ncbi:MAG: hypothetical protein GY898_26790 [Proteobacteria bacterium]|nr:hypothetical protein [Pseudomonadota bacterium]
MESKVPLFVLAAAIVLGALAVATSGDGDVEALEARIASLERQVQTLEQQAATETTRAQVRRSTAEASAAFEGRRRDRPRGHRGAALPGVDVESDVVVPRASPALADALREGSDDPEVREQLGAVIRDEMDAAREERWEERRERSALRREERVEQLRADAGLTDEQADFVEGLLTDESEAVWAMFRAAREDGSWGDAHDKADEMRADTDERAGEQLSDEQLAAYRAMREEEEARRFGRRR